ncbi:hypothetical protein BRYFOR_09931 [Marvinbryantia formatexigens DSM 14469]|uniref:Uncharacterized protein n=1 Tax=Marvinbryantia formatexigens DSM 14469 TaxID=478749 RepID=C6LMN0_9FIRM|nr:hypothetical protein BRYFOR_09931 [Marvinbryantia formatexigens DSM 14469]
MGNALKIAACCSDILTIVYPAAGRKGYLSGRRLKMGTFLPVTDTGQIERLFSLVRHIFH